jgi:HK97 family phage major capsid protein
MQTSKEIRSAINKLLTDMSALAAKPWNTESRASFDRMAADSITLEEDFKRAEILEQRTTPVTTGKRSPRPGAKESNRSEDEQRSEVRNAMLAFARGGKFGMTQEQRDLVTTSDSTGGALIPQLYNPELFAALKYYGPIAQLVKTRVTENNGAPIKVALTNDTGNGLQLIGAEPAPTVGTTGGLIETDPAFVSKIVGVDTVTAGLVKISVQELEDASFDLDSWIRDAFGLRYARGMERLVTLGTDMNGVTLPNQATGGMAAVATVGTTTSTLAAGIGWDDLTATYGALDPAYTNPAKAVWQFNSSTRAYLVGLKDGFGRPFFQADPANDEPFARIAGFKVVLNQSLPNMGASAKPILFGDPSAAYFLRTDGQPSIVRLNERFLDTLEVGFFLYLRAGGTSIVMSGAPSPLAALQQASS